MRSAIKTILFLAVILLIVFVSNKSLQDTIIDNGLKLDNDEEYLVFGDSHGTCSFNPSYVSNLKNLSNYGESLLFSYYKLKNILERNSNNEEIKVVISLSHHSIYKGRENYKDPKQRAKIIQQYYPLLDDNGFDVVGKSSTEYYLTKAKYDFGVPFQFKTTLENLASGKPAFIVGYKNENISYNVNLAHAKIKMEDHYKNEIEPIPSKILLEYLNKIIELTNKHEIPLIIFNTPKNELYFSVLPASIEKEYEKTINTLLQKSSNAYFYDLSKYIKEDSLFRDTDHLNSSGAKVFSQKVDSCLREIPHF